MRGIDLDCIKRWPWDLRFVKTQTYEMCIEALKRDGLLLKEVRWDELSLSEKQIFNLYIIAVRQNGFALMYVKNQTEELCREAVMQNGLALEYVDKQTQEICLETVKENGLALRYVKKQTPEICLEAVEQDKFAIRYVKWSKLEGKFSEEQTDEICRKSLKQNKLAIKYIINKEKYLKEFNIKYLKEQDDAKEVIVIKEAGEWLFTIGCQSNITKKEFIYRIYNTNGGFDPEKGINVHRQIYLDFLKEF
ncbi:hypothetical protein BGU81_12720 [Clostridioides difficile]|nr:hypothetical protein BGU81_12720 [Clostridioides difficile]